MVFLLAAVVGHAATDIDTDLLAGFVQRRVHGASCLRLT